MISARGTKVINATSLVITIAREGMSAAGLITLMLPYSATALILLLIWIQVAAAKAPHVCGLPIGVSMLPRLAAIVCMATILRSQ